MSSTKNSSDETSTTTSGDNPSETSSKLTSKNSELFDFDPATVLDVEFEEIVARMRKIVTQNRKARSLKEVDEARAYEEAQKKRSKKKKGAEVTL